MSWKFTPLSYFSVILAIRTRLLPFKSIFCCCWSLSYIRAPTGVICIWKVVGFSSHSLLSFVRIDKEIIYRNWISCEVFLYCIDSIHVFIKTEVKVMFSAIIQLSCSINCSVLHCAREAFFPGSLPFLYCSHSSEHFFWLEKSVWVRSTWVYVSLSICLSLFLSLFFMFFLLDYSLECILPYYFFIYISFCGSLVVIMFT